MNINFGSVITKYRKKQGLTQAQLAEQLHITRATVLNWEADRSHPELAMLPLLCSLLHIPPMELFSLEATPDGMETLLLNGFRKLTPEGKQLSLRLMATLVADERARQASRPPVSLPDARRLMPLRRRTATPLAAGEGYSYADAEDEGYCFALREAVPAGADTVMRVKGPSMEPVYHDGDLVYVHSGTTARGGDTVVCAMDAGCVIKRLTRDGKLASLNPDYPFEEKFEDNHVRILGTVLGVVEEGSLAAGQEDVLAEELAPEIAQLEKRLHR